MASAGASDKRAKLAKSRVQWGHMDLYEFPKDQGAQGSLKKDSISRWLTTTVEEDAKHEPEWKSPEPLRRNTSSDDDLALGVEASQYCNQGVGTVQDFLRWSRASPAVSRWNSFGSSASDPSGPLSVMDILNLWNDNPEDILLDLGFGYDEPDLSGRIPARFINYPSQARGINLQVFLEAQKSRLDLENPDVSNRFRQLEVLQQVTTAFSALMGPAPSPKATQEKELLPEARERRRRMGMLFRRASKNTLDRMKNQKSQDTALSVDTFPLCDSPESHHPSSCLMDNRIPLKRMKTGLGKLETSCLSPLAEEQGLGSDPQPESEKASLVAQDRPFKSWTLRDGCPPTTNPYLQRKKSPGPGRESFEMEEIHSFDESSLTGSVTGAAENLVRCLARTNSCQSDSSGFLEEPFIPSQCQQESPASDLIKALSCLSGGSTDSHNSEKPVSPSLTPTCSSPCLQRSSSLTSPGVGNTLLSSPCPSPEHSEVFDPSTCPVQLYPSKSVDDVSETETAPKQESQSALLPRSEQESLPSCPPSLDLENTSQSQSEIPESSTPLVSPSPSLVEPGSLIKGSEERKHEGDSHLQHLSTLSCESSNPACVDSPCMTPTPLSPSSTPSFDYGCHSTTSLRFEEPENTQSQQIEGSFHETSPSGICTFQDSSSPDLQIDSKEHHFQDQDGKAPPDPASFTQIQKDQENPVIEPAFSQDSSSNERNDFSTNPSFPDCQSSSSLESSDQKGLIKPTEGTMTDFKGELVYQQDGPYSNNDNKNIDSSSPIRDGIPSEMDYLSLDLQDTPQRTVKEEIQSWGYFDKVQTQESVKISESSADLSEDSISASKEVWNQKGNDVQVFSCSLIDKMLTDTKSEVEIQGTGNKSPRSPIPLCDEAPEEEIRNENEPRGLFEVESLDVIFQTSVDDSEGDSGDMDAFLQQLDTERQVYWAEPILVSNTDSSLEESGSFEGSSRSPLVKPGLGRAGLDSLTSTGTATLIEKVPANPNRKLSVRSVSVQMSSFPSSHIIHRKDVPYVTNSKRTFLSTDFPLDTSTPFRAVQSWTDLHIHRNKLLSHGATNRVKNGAIATTCSLETIQSPTMIVSLSPSLPVLTKDWKSYDSLPGVDRDYHTVSVSLDKELWSDDEEEVNRNENEDERNLWEGNQTATMACCCSCDHHKTSCYMTQETPGHLPYSLDELEEMMLCLQQFRSVLCNMEQQLSEDQASVYSALSDQDREKVQDIEELRQAVKKEVGELEMQLNELAHHYDDSLKMKMHRLLDEQSLLCTQLRVPHPGKWPSTSSPGSNRTEAGQYHLPQTLPADPVSSWTTWNQDSPRQSPPASDSNCEALNCSPTKVDKVDIVSFLQRLKETLRHSVNTDSLE